MIPLIFPFYLATNFINIYYFNYEKPYLNYYFIDA